jgi:hypothetical protein
MKSTINSSKNIKNNKTIMNKKGNSKLISKIRKSKKIIKKNDYIYFQTIVRNDDIFNYFGHKDIFL